MSSELLYLHDAHLRTLTATAVEVDGNRVRLDRTGFYPTGGGQPVTGTGGGERRHGLMRTHRALHILCGVIRNEWGTAVTESKGKANKRIRLEVTDGCAAEP